MSEPEAHALEVRGATKRFGAKVVLDAVDLTVPAGSFCVLLGPSGSGKTTLLRCVAGIERLHAGSVSIGGVLVADGPAHRPPERRDLAMVFQDYALWPHLTVTKNVQFPLGRNGTPKSDRDGRARQMLDRVGLCHLADRYPNELSGGEQQRVALARALVGTARLVLFDEPLSNLDADLRDRMRLEISTLARSSGTTAVYITHDQSEAFALADMIGVLRHGRFVQFGSPEEVYHRPCDPFVARFTGLAGELAVEVAGPAIPTGEGAWKMTVRPRRMDLCGPEPLSVTVAGGRPPERAGRLMVRPAAVRLASPGDPAGHLEGLVLDSAYRGRGYDHAILVADGTQLTAVHDDRRWNRGDHVSVHLESSGCLLFPDDEESGAETAELHRARGAVA